ncbi:Uncharacterised protein [Serratia plymuthica]|nr:Uncharacterised protein [Serratia plymuthica]
MESSTVLTTNEDIKLKPNPKTKKSGFVFSSLVILIMIFVFIYWTLQPHINLAKQPTLLLYQYKKCKVYALLDSNGNANKDELTKMARADIQSARGDLQSEVIDCTRTNFDIYYNKTRPNNQLSKRTLIGACERDDQGNQGQCMSVVTRYGEKK